jgi:hypothetical protein
MAGRTTWTSEGEHNGNGRFGIHGPWGWGSGRKDIFAVVRRPHPRGARRQPIRLIASRGSRSRRSRRTRRTNVNAPEGVTECHLRRIFGDRAASATLTPRSASVNGVRCMRRPVTYPIGVAPTDCRKRRTNAAREKWIVSASTATVQQYRAEIRVGNGRQQSRLDGTVRQALPQRMFGQCVEKPVHQHHRAEPCRHRLGDDQLPQGCRCDARLVARFALGMPRWGMRIQCRRGKAFDFATMPQTCIIPDQRSCPPSCSPMNPSFAWVPSPAFLQ